MSKNKYVKKTITIVDKVSNNLVINIVLKSILSQFTFCGGIPLFISLTSILCLCSIDSAIRQRIVGIPRIANIIPTKYTMTVNASCIKIISFHNHCKGENKKIQSRRRGIIDMNSILFSIIALLLSVVSIVINYWQNKK